MRLARLLQSFAVCFGLAVPAQAEVRTFAWDDFSHLTRHSTTNAPFGDQVESSWITPDMPWREAIVSWNARLPDSDALAIEIRAVVGGIETPWLQMGHWSPSTNRFPRTSIRGQTNRLARVDTDTVVLSANGERFQWRASFTSSASTNLLRYLTVSLWHPDPASISTNVTLIRNLNLGFIGPPSGE